MGEILKKLSILFHSFALIAPKGLKREQKYTLKVSTVLNGRTISHISENIEVYQEFHISDGIEEHQQDVLADVVYDISQDIEEHREKLRDDEDAVEDEMGKNSSN